MAINQKEFFTNMKHCLCLLLCLVLLVTLPACKKKQYTDTLSADTLAEEAQKAIGAETGDYTVADQRLLDGYFTRPKEVDDFTVLLYTDRNNINELGIFHLRDGNPRALADLIKGYLATALEENRDWYASYIPAEIPKLRDAEVRVFGNYVVYAILSENDRAHLFEQIETILTA